MPWNFNKMPNSFQFPPEIKNEFIICANVDVCLGQLAYNDAMAVAVSRKHALNNPIISSKDIHCFDDTEHFITSPIVMFIPRNHPLQSVINQRLQWAVEGGLINKWSSESRAKYNEPINEHAGPVVLVLEHFVIGFSFYFIANLFAFCVFILEHVAYSKMRQQNASRFWSFMDFLIDDHRYFWIPITRQRHRL